MVGFVDKLKFFIQAHRREVVLFILFFLVGTISFALGYLTAGQIIRTPIVIEKNSQLP